MSAAHCSDVSTYFSDVSTYFSDVSTYCSDVSTYFSDWSAIRFGVLVIENDYGWQQQSWLKVNKRLEPNQEKIISWMF
jgi:hypothetical protein